VPVSYIDRRFAMKILIAGGTGAIGRPLIAGLLARGHRLVALTRSPEKAQALAEEGVEPAIADVFDADAVQAVVRRAQPEVVIEQLTALPRSYTRESMSAAAALNHRLRLEGGANVLAAAQAAGVRRYLRQSIIQEVATAEQLLDGSRVPRGALHAADRPIVDCGLDCIRCCIETCETPHRRPRIKYLGFRPHMSSLLQRRQP
jgi:hypothetical protein